MKLYDENEAVDFILADIDQYEDIERDLVIDIIDALYDYYEENDGLDFDLDDDDDMQDEENMDDIVKYIAHKEGLAEDLIKRVVTAEMKYQDTLL